MTARVALALLLSASLAAVAFQATRPGTPAAPSSLTAYVPQDALLSIEAPDFAALLHQWTASPQSKAWLASDQYSVFQNSRLFGRLAEAQASFAEAAGLPASADLLDQVAGTRSIFAWYDVGKLEFLYITRMPAAQASQTTLLQSRGSFQRRHAGNSDFFLRTRGTDPARTVAFAQVPSPSGDLLLLATREDLIANALVLIASPRGASLAQEPWFTDAASALPAEKPSPALHMVLNLDRIVPMPSFRSYWVQQNITWMSQFRSAASDLYLEPTRFREERVLLPKASAPPALSPPDLAALAALVPAGTGVFRAFATSSPAEAVTAIDSRLLGLYTAEKTRAVDAEDPSLATPQPGSAADLETRIDTPVPVSASASSDALSAAISAARLDAILTVSSAALPATPNGLWVPIHSAVALHGDPSTPWNPHTLAEALQQNLHGTLTVAAFGLEFRSSTVAGQTVYSLTGPRPLFFAISAPGTLALLSDDRPLLLSLLAKTASLPPSQAPRQQAATLIAGFDHTSQRAPYTRLTALIDGTNNASARRTAAPPDATAAPTFFSQQMRSLSDTFAALASEQILERTVASNLRQTVTYNWHTP